MPVKKDALGQHRVEMEWLAPGTPEQVWDAIATGPGISAWFTEARVEPRVGGEIAFSFGDGVASSGTVTGWEPPRRFAYEERGWSENAPPIATEIAVTARSGGTCLVRMVHSLFAATDDWDDQLEGFESGWQGFFEVMRLYLTHFPGQRAASVRLRVVCAAGEAAAWSRVCEGLGLGGANVGDHCRAPDGAPPLSGVVERIFQNHQGRELHVRGEPPGSGVTVLGAYTLRGTAHVFLSAYFYGAGSDEQARRYRASATPWLDRLMTS
jgi:uncharacterized protein YndB with AHSA1/START domain